MLPFILLTAYAELFGKVLALPQLSVSPRSAQNEPLTPELLDSFKFYAQHAAAAYCNVDKTAPGQDICCANNGCPRLEGNNVTAVAVTTGAVTGIGAYIAVDHTRREVVTSLRGTTNVRNFITDARFLLQDADDIASGAKVDSGFLAAWHEISAGVSNGIRLALGQFPQYRVILVGHSLGAGTATVALPYLRREFPVVDLFGYGTERAGNDVFADYVSNQAAGAVYRIEHYNDIAASIPPLVLGYRHTNMEYWLSTGPADKVDYTLSQVLICEGNANLSCSGSKVPDITGRPHRYILHDLYACGGLQFIQ